MVLQKFLLSDLFDITTTKGFDKNKLKFVSDGECDFVGRTTLEWGLQGTLHQFEIEPNPENVFSLIQVGETAALWRERKWYASQNLFMLKPKFNEINENYLYLQSCINKEMTVYGKDYGSYPTLKKLNDTMISLPTLTNPNNTPVIDPEHKYHPEGYIPDWEYMQDYIKELEQDYIKELEQDYIKELEQYLIVTGLNDYELTDEDREVLGQKITGREIPYQNRDDKNIVRNGKEVREFLIKNIADVSYGTKFDKNKMTRNNPCINFVSRTASNNGISDYVDIYEGTKPLKPGLITLALGGSVGSCFLQEKPFYTGQNVGVINITGEITKEAKLYFVSALEKKCKNSFHAFGNEINKHLKTDLSVLLPVKDEIDPNCQYHPDGYIPDWEYMEKYVRAIEKLVIKDVVKYKDEMIEKMKGMVD